MKVAIYARVSTLDKGQNPEVQLVELRAYCERMRYEYKEYVDYASGANDRRPQYQQLKEDADKRKFDILLVWKLDRLGRSLSDLLRFIDLLRVKHIEFRSHTEAMDTTTAAGQLLFHIVGAFAEWEHNLLSERVRAGMAKAKQDGKKLGRNKVVIPLKLVEVLSEEKSKGASWREITQLCHAKARTAISTTTIRRALAKAV